MKLCTSYSRCNVLNTVRSYLLPSLYFTNCSYVVSRIRLILFYKRLRQKNKIKPKTFSFQPFALKQKNGSKPKNFGNI